ncbi:MAG: hypothetical protein L6R36_007545, partial [Xanthoria steineri]
MAVRSLICLLLLSFFHALVINTSPAPFRPTPLAALVAKMTKTHQLPDSLQYFPPGPPEDHYLHILEDTDLGVEFFSIGRIPHRDEGAVKKVILDGIHETLRYRVNAKMPGHGWKLEEGGFLLSVGHAAGQSELTWGMWTIVLTGMNGYVQAYPGYDFQFNIRKYMEEDIRG